MNSIEIFSGAGGLAKGLEIAGVNHLAFIEWNSDACKSLRANFNEDCVFEGDIRTFLLKITTMLMSLPEVLHANLSLLEERQKAIMTKGICFHLPLKQSAP